MLTIGKMLTTNCNTLNDKITSQIINTEQPLVAAARLCNVADIIYLTADSGDASQLQKLLTKEVQKDNAPLLPPVLSLANLVAAAFVDSTQLKNPAQLINTARLISPPHRQTLLAMDIYSLLRPRLKTKSDSAVLAFARSLANLFVEFVQNYPTLIIPENALPELLDTLEDSYHRESDVIRALWSTIYENDLFAARRPNGLASFAKIAPPIIFVDPNRCRPQWCDDFLQQCNNNNNDEIKDSLNAVVDNQLPIIYENNKLTETTLWEDIINGEKEILPPQNIQQCWEGGAASLHQTANIALEMVCKFAANDSSVGIVIYNRLLARRLRAIAEVKGVLIQDDGGWRMETLSFGGALRQWVNTIAAEFTPDNFTRLLAPPYWKNDSANRNAAEESWRAWLASERTLPASWQALQEIANSSQRSDAKQHRDHAIATFSENIFAARKQMPTHAVPLSTWVQWLLQQSKKALAVWQNDSTAIELRATMQQVATAEYNMTETEFFVWLDMFMSDATSGDSIESKIRFVSPATTKQFGSLILLGATAENLPGAADVFFGEKGRTKINLCGRNEHLQQQFMQFWRLLSAHPKIAAVWQKNDKGESSPSPFWTVFTDLWKQEKKEVFNITAAKSPFDDLADNITLPPPPFMAKTTLKKFPPKLSITAMQQLMQCPYHFYMKNILSLREEDGEEAIGHAALGKLLHRAMEEFIKTDAISEDALRSHWQNIFNKILSDRRGVKFACEHWRQFGDTFIREEFALRNEGWQTHLHEHRIKEAWQLGEQTVVLQGRLDRADCKNDGANSDSDSADSWSIIDYKSSGGTSKSDLENGENPQLPLYAFLLSLTLAQPAAKTWRIAYPIKNDKNTKVEGGDAARIALHIRDVLNQIAGGTPMPANGKPSVCARCESRRLCRREHWQTN